ncbi:MAG: hypothetical protein KIG29_05085 [Oscillospiraceae bacterium]|nr:hypothetical protein [Oscillospiraceae bacterium]MDY6020911.1 hypothetical protein [Oscillospiraceae bacterium]
MKTSLLFSRKNADFLPPARREKIAARDGHPFHDHFVPCSGAERNGHNDGKGKKTCFFVPARAAPAC